MSTLCFYAQYQKGGLNTAPADAPTIEVCAVNRTAGGSFGAETIVTSAGAMTASGITGRYYFLITGANLQSYDFHASVHTADTATGLDARDLPALWVRWSEAVATDAAGGVNATQLGGQVVTATAGITIPASVGTSTYAGGAVASVTAAVPLPANAPATFLDAISVADPGGVSGQTTFPKILVALYRRFLRKATVTATALACYADDGVTVNTTQPLSDDGTTQTQGPPA